MLTDQITWKTISTIGKSCIIKVSLVPQVTDFSCPKIWEMLVAAFRASHNIETFDAHAADARLRETMPANQILEIITIDEPEFLRLTDCVNWRSPLLGHKVED